LVNAAPGAAKVALANILDNAEVLADRRSGSDRRHDGSGGSGHRRLGHWARRLAARGGEALRALLPGQSLALDGRARLRPWAGDLAGTRRAPGRADLRGGADGEGRDVRRAPLACLSGRARGFAGGVGHTPMDSSDRKSVV